MSLPRSLEHDAEDIAPVTSMDVQALRAGDDGGGRANPIVNLPVVDGDHAQAGVSVRPCHLDLVLSRTRRGLA